MDPRGAKEGIAALCATEPKFGPLSEEMNGSGRVRPDAEMVVCGGLPRGSSGCVRARSAVYLRFGSCLRCEASESYETMRQSSRRTSIAQSPWISRRRSLVGSLIESLRGSLQESRRRANPGDAAPGRAGWIWGIRLALAVGTLALASPAGAVLLIDDFSSTQNLVLASEAEFVASSAPALDAIGGERDLEIKRVTGSGVATVNVNAGDQGQLLFDSPPATEAILRLVWDGPDGDAQTDDFTGLESVDLTDGGALEAFEIEFDSELTTRFSLRIYDWSDSTGMTWSEATVDVDATPSGTFGFLEIPFTEFSLDGPEGAASFANVGAVSLEIAGPAGFDLALQSVRVVPEPAATSLAGLAALALLAHRRRSTRS